MGPAPITATTSPDRTGTRSRTACVATESGSSSGAPVGALEVLAEFGRLLECPPGAEADGLLGALLLLDPRHELRALAAGTAPAPLTGLRFVASLAGVAPGYDTLHAPWSGAYRAVDHGLLFAPDAGWNHVLPFR